MTFFVRSAFVRSAFVRSAASRIGRAAGVLVVGFWLTAPALAELESLDASAIRQKIQGNTATLPTSSMGIVKLYFAPDGALRGRYEGEPVRGRWWIEDDRLCYDLPGKRDDGCRTVVRRDGDRLQLFTAIGEPAGDLYVSQGNPEKL